MHRASPTSDEASARTSQDEAGSADLAFALCHEISNLVGAVRLHAHLLDDDMGPRELARASVELDDLSARASALLTHIRPLLSPRPGKRDVVVPGALVEGVRRQMDEQGVRGTHFTAHVETGLPALEIDQDVIHPLLMSLLFCALEAATPRGSVALRAEGRPEGVAFVVEDNGAVDEDPALWREQMQRGRPLLCAVASSICAKREGHLEAVREDGLTRVALVLPVS